MFVYGSDEDAALHVETGSRKAVYLACCHKTFPEIVLLGGRDLVVGNQN